MSSGSSMRAALANVSGTEQGSVVESARALNASVYCEVVVADVAVVVIASSQDTPYFMPSFSW